MDPSSEALVALGRYLQSQAYHFTAITPLSHQRSNRRNGAALAKDLRGIFGWSRPFAPDDFAPVTKLLAAAGELEAEGETARSRVRFATLGDQLYVHSAYPTLADDAVFFGPDTYRFVRVIQQCVPRPSDQPMRLLDLGCGSGAGGLFAAAMLALNRSKIVLSDINEKALRYARVNAALNGIADVEFVRSDLFADLDGTFDVVMSNPPYLVDPLARAYRHGGAEGFDLSVRIVEQSLDRLAPGGRLILYTGTPVVHGVDRFREALTRLLMRRRISWHYEEIDPDVFGEELETAAYQDADRIAAVSVIIDAEPANAARTGVESLAVA